MELIILGLFGMFCIVIGYVIGMARAQWLHWKTGKLMREIDRTKSDLLQLQYEIHSTLEASGYLEDGE